MKTLLAFLAIALCCSELQAQNIEHQIIASQFGAYQVPTVGNGFAFPPDTCQVSGGGKNFPAFTVSVPIKIVDSNPAHTEVQTPVAVNLNNNNCSVSMTTTYPHASFYLTSGTGGLQEALNAGQVTGGANTVILDQQWYVFVAPSNPATVIASVHGNTALSIVDITTAPYTFYAWNGSAYASVPYPAGIASVFGRTGPTITAQSGDYTVSQVTGAAPLASPALTGTPTVPTAAPGNNTTQAASTAFVLANGGGPPTGTAGGALSGTYPNPTIAVGPLPAGMLATTNTTGDNTNKVATDAFVNATAAAGPLGGAGGALSGSYPNPLVTGAINPSSTGATTPGPGAFTMLSATSITSAPYTITASATPSINFANGSVQTITLTSSATATVTGISAGSRLAMRICEGSTVYAWTWPAAIHGGICVGSSCTPYATQPNTCSMQTFNSYNGTTLVPENIGVVNIAP